MDERRVKIALRTPDDVVPMSLRRNRFEIWSEVLEACLRNCRTQSWLMRKVGVKTSAMKEALDFLDGTGLIEKVEKSDVGLNFEFRTTAKGEQALLHYYRLITDYFTHNRNEHRRGMRGLRRYFTRERED